jgi:hypothetical protein
MPAYYNGYVGAHLLRYYNGHIEASIRKYYDAYRVVPTHGYYNQCPEAYIYVCYCDKKKRPPFLSIVMGV